jgi:hypothetical protein
MKDAMEAKHPIDSGTLPENFTLRDRFAIVALTELIGIHIGDTAERKALEAYQIADAMMRQRRRAESGR